MDRDELVRKIIFDGTDPSWDTRTLEDWTIAFEARLEEARGHAEFHDDEERPEPTTLDGDANQVGFVDERGMRIFQKKRKAENRMADRRGISMEKTDVALGGLGSS